ncbi:MAG: HAD family phosphatase [Butyricicoccus pullicaecorum]|nr:HAD family phosphatase [Butyricicoccus pullicaecorum]
MERKLLFLDLDGTLLNDAKKITAGNRKALERLLEQGHGVIITTGRPLQSALKQAHLLGLDHSGCYVIAYNGAVIYDFETQQQIFSQTLSFANAIRIFEYANAQNIHIQTYDTWNVLVEPRCHDEAVRRYCELIQMDYRTIADIHTDLQEQPVKCLAIDFNEQTKLVQMQHWIQNNMSQELDCFFSCQAYLEIVPIGMNKGKAVQMLSHIMNIPISNTIAVGDAANDIPMLQAAGIGIAMANAAEEVKAAADALTQRDNNHDGIAEVITHYFQLN